MRIPKAFTMGKGIRSCGWLMRKLDSDLSVCAPQYLSAATWISPKASDSLLVAAILAMVVCRLRTGLAAAAVVVLSLAGNILAAFVLTAGMAVPRRARSRTLGRIIMSGAGRIARGEVRGNYSLVTNSGDSVRVSGDLGHVSLTGNTLIFVL